MCDGTRFLEAVGAVDRPIPLGDYSGKFIREGESYQAVVPDFLRSEASEERGDALQEIHYTPLTEPPFVPPIPDLAGERAAAERAAAQKAVEAMNRQRGPTVTTEEVDLDEDGCPLLPEGVAVREGFVLAWGTNAGQRRQYKAVLMAVRPIFPPLLVKYVGDENGSRNPLLLPEVRNSYVNLGDVSRWIPPEEREPSPAAAAIDPAAEGGGSSASGDAEAKASVDEGGPRRASSRSTRFVKPELQLLTEAGGVQLHLDPRRLADGYEGTGYRGVHDDYWHTGFKRDRPFVVVHDGAYQGRFATVEQAAVNYARLEMGMPPLVLEPQQKNRAAQVPAQQPQSTRKSSRSSSSKSKTLASVAADSSDEPHMTSAAAVPAKRQKGRAR